MKKAIGEAAILIGIFFASLFIMQRFDWVQIFNIDRITRSTEAKMGDALWDIFKRTEKESKNKFAIQSIDSIVDRICTSNNILRDSIKVHILEKDEVNAFALPNAHLVVYSGLITECNNPEEIAGVLGHEIAHIELRHVMKKLIKEIGLTMLNTIGSGKAGGEVGKQAAKVLSSTAFDRTLEKQADMAAVDYHIEANIDPEPFSDFMSRLSDKEGDAMQYLSWASTHPDSRERSEYILDYFRGREIIKKQLLTEETWIKLQDIYDGGGD